VNFSKGGKWQEWFAKKLHTTGRESRPDMGGKVYETGPGGKLAALLGEGLEPRPQSVPRGEWRGKKMLETKGIGFALNKKETKEGLEELFMEDAAKY